MKINFRKLSQKGFLSLHILLPAVIAIATIGGVGAYVLTKSHAASSLDSVGCYVRGRTWTSSGTCSKTCLSGAGSITTASPYDYCSNSISKISSTTCSALHRRWVDVGCARVWQQTTTMNAKQCAMSNYNYAVMNPYDTCVDGSVTYQSAHAICAFSAVPSKPVNGNSFTVYTAITNNGKLNFGDAYTSIELDSAPSYLNFVRAKTGVITAGQTKVFKLTINKTQSGLDSNGNSGKIIYSSMGNYISGTVGSGCNTKSWSF